MTVGDIAQAGGKAYEYLVDPLAGAEMQKGGKIYNLLEDGLQEDEYGDLTTVIMQMAMTWLGSTAFGESHIGGLLLNQFVDKFGQNLINEFEGAEDLVPKEVQKRFQKAAGATEEQMNTILKVNFIAQNTPEELTADEMEIYEKHGLTRQESPEEFYVRRAEEEAAKRIQAGIATTPKNERNEIMKEYSTAARNNELQPVMMTEEEYFSANKSRPYLWKGENYKAEQERMADAYATLQLQAAKEIVGDYVPQIEEAQAADKQKAVEKKEEKIEERAAEPIAEIVTPEVKSAPNRGSQPTAVDANLQKAQAQAVAAVQASGARAVMDAAQPLPTNTPTVVHSTTTAPVGQAPSPGTPPPAPAGAQTPPPGASPQGQVYTGTRDDKPRRADYKDNNPYGNDRKLGAYEKAEYKGDKAQWEAARDQNRGQGPSIGVEVDLRNVGRAARGVSNAYENAQRRVDDERGFFKKVIAIVEGGSDAARAAGTAVKVSTGPRQQAAYGR